MLFWLQVMLLTHKAYAKTLWLHLLGFYSLIYTVWKRQLCEHFVMNGLTEMLQIMRYINMQVFLLI